MKDIYQGTILKIENLKYPVFVVSNNYFNKADGIIGCPIAPNGKESATHISIKDKDIEGIILCEQVRFLDLSVRGFKIISHSELNTTMNIVDIVQGFFDFA